MSSGRGCRRAGQVGGQEKREGNRIMRAEGVVGRGGVEVNKGEGQEE